MLARTIIKNRHVQNEAVAGPLQYLDKLTAGFREPRNLIAHDAGYSEPDPDKLHTLFFVPQDERVDPDLIRFRPWAKQLADEFVTSRKAVLNTTVQRRESSVEAVLEPLADVVEARLASLDD